MAKTKAQIQREMQQRKAKAKQINKASAAKRAEMSAGGNAKTPPITIKESKFTVPPPKPGGANQSGKKTFTNKDLK